MDDSWSFVFALPGFYAGMFLWQHMVLWFGTIYSMTRLASSPLPMDDARVKAQLYVVLLVGVSWLVAFGAVVFYLARGGTSKPGWAWFFVGVAAVPCVLVSLIWHHRWPRKRVRGPSPWGDE